MCPDEKTLSVYYDGDVEEKWARIIDSHIQSCQRCQTILKNWQLLSEKLNPFTDNQISKIKQRSWGKISQLIESPADHAIIQLDKTIYDFADKAKNPPSHKGSFHLPYVGIAAMAAVLLSFLTIQIIQTPNINSFNLITGTKEALKADKLHAEGKLANDSLWGREAYSKGGARASELATPSYLDSVPYIPQISTVSSNPLIPSPRINELPIAGEIKPMFKKLEKQGEPSIDFLIPTEFNWSCKGHPNLEVETCGQK